MPLDIAVLFGCALPTGSGIITNDLCPTIGSSIAIFGLGGIGMSALMAIMLFQCNKVIAIDVSSGKLELARFFGATHTIDASASNPISEILTLTDGQGVDYAVEASGNTKVIEQASLHPFDVTVVYVYLLLILNMDLRFQSTLMN